MTLSSDVERLINVFPCQTSVMESQTVQMIQMNGTVHVGSLVFLFIKMYC